MIEVLHSNFIRTARAKGLPLRTIVLRHALKPALLPVLSYMGPALLALLRDRWLLKLFLAYRVLANYLSTGR